MSIVPNTSSQDLTVYNFDSQRFTSDVPPFPYPGPQGPVNVPPTLQYLVFYAAPSGAGWAYENGVMFLNDPLLIFSSDPVYPQENPPIVTFTCTMVTGSLNGHYWQTSAPTLPRVALNVMGKSGYRLLPDIALGTMNCSPYSQTISLQAPFEADLWDSIDYCNLEVGGSVAEPAAFWMNLG